MNKGTFGAFSGRSSVGQSPGLAPLWESPDTGTLGSTFIQWSHGLNFRPKLVQMGVRALVLDGGWSAGYELDISSCFFPVGISSFPGCTPPQYWTSTIIGFGAYDAATGVYMYALNASMNGQFALTTSYWRPFARIFG